MTQNSNSPDNLADDALPKRLRDELARIDHPQTNIPPALDHRILAEAKAGFRRRLRFNPIVRWAAAVTAVAAVLAISFGIWMQKHHISNSPIATVGGVSHSSIPGDINGDGKVDMLDAYLLARELASGAPPDPRHDVNGDGIVDQRDVDSIANSAVKIGGANP